MKSALNILPLALSLGQLRVANALDDGIGVKPHMGWSSWVREATRTPMFVGVTD